MPLGTNGFQVMMGDLVKVISSRWIAIPIGTIAAVSGIMCGKEKKYLLSGYENEYVSGEELELVSYTRNIEDPWE